MAVSGERAYQLLVWVYERVKGSIPPGVMVTISHSGRRVSLTGAEIASGRGLGIWGLGTWIPFVPKQKAQEMAAQHAVEAVLDIAYPAGQRWKPGAVDFDVRVAVDGDVARASYLPPGAADRVELDPIPVSML
jgi:hypothetical protein